MKLIANQIGIFYICTNSIYFKEGWYKFGITQNPIERKRIQNNSAPASFPLQNRIVVLSKNFKEIEQEFEKEMIAHNLIDVTSLIKGSKEWFRVNSFEEVIHILSSIIIQYEGTKICYDRECYKVEKGLLKRLYKFPKCQLDLLGIYDGDQILCVLDKKNYTVSNNGILVEGVWYSLSTFINKFFPRESNTNEHNGYSYFMYKKEIISDLWTNLFYFSRSIRGVDNSSRL